MHVLRKNCFSLLPYCMTAEKKRYMFLLNIDGATDLCENKS